MKTRLIVTMLVLVFLVSACGAKPAATVGSIQISAPWALTAKSGESTAAFMVIKNTSSQADRLVKAEFSPAMMVQPMNVGPDANGKMAMYGVDAIEVPAKGQVELKSGSFHIMLMKLTKDLNVGDKFSITLTFEKSGAVTFDLPIKTK